MAGGGNTKTRRRKSANESESESERVNVMDGQEHENEHRAYVRPPDKKTREPIITFTFTTTQTESPPRSCGHPLLAACWPAPGNA